MMTSSPKSQLLPRLLCWAIAFLGLAIIGSVPQSRLVSSRCPRHRAGSCHAGARPTEPACVEPVPPWAGTFPRVAGPPASSGVAIPDLPCSVAGATLQAIGPHAHNQSSVASGPLDALTPPPDNSLAP